MVLCFPRRLILYDFASAAVNASFSFAVVATTVKLSILTAAIIRSLPIFSTIGIGLLRFA